MRCLIVGGAMFFAIATSCSADGLFWVVGNSATATCEIVTSNPVVVGDVSFADGPYKSLDDAKLARSTIRVCPKEDSASDEGGSKTAN